MLPTVLPILGVILCLVYVVLRVIHGIRSEPESVYFSRPVTTVKVLALVLGSVWFFPVSCTSTLIAGYRVITHLDARDVARGDRVHRQFSIVVEPGDRGGPFRSVRLYELPRLRETGKAYSLLMSKLSGRIALSEYGYVSYRVLENQGSVQVIEVEEGDDDGAVWSRYRATPTDVTPLASRLDYPGYIFGAPLLIAFGAALLLYGTGRLLRRMLSVAGLPSINGQWRAPVSAYFSGPVTTVRVLALVLGSVWFLPVSCTSALIPLSRVIAHMDDREVARGDSVHSGFSVVVEPGDDGKAFRLVCLSDLPQFRAKAGAYSLLMSKPSGSIDVNGYTQVSYRVVENRSSVQVIEVEDRSGAATRWSRYRATPIDVTPLASRLSYDDDTMSALPSAFFAAVLLYGIGRLLRWRLGVAGVASTTS